MADEADFLKLGQRRGVVYTGPEARLIISVADPETVSELHRFKSTFNGVLTDRHVKAAHDFRNGKQPKVGRNTQQAVATISRAPVRIEFRPNPKARFNCFRFESIAGIATTGNRIGSSLLFP